MLKILLFGGMFLLSKSALASGCFWYDRYELGPKVPDYQSKGYFSCREFSGWKTCVFKSPSGERYQSGWLQPTNAPPESKEVTVNVTSNEAMWWQDCDGGDPIPPYEKNGVYSSFQFQKATYISFSKR